MPIKWSLQTFFHRRVWLIIGSAIVPFFFQLEPQLKLEFIWQIDTFAGRGMDLMSTVSVVWFQFHNYGYPMILYSYKQGIPLIIRQWTVFSISYKPVEDTCGTHLLFSEGAPFKRHLSIC